MADTTSLATVTLTYTREGDLSTASFTFTGDGLHRVVFEPSTAIPAEDLAAILHAWVDELIDKGAASFDHGGALRDALEDLS